MGLEKSLEAIHLIQGEMTQPPTGTVTWACRNALECSKKIVVVFWGACRRERLKDDWEHVAAESLKQLLRADTDTRLEKFSFSSNLDEVTLNSKLQSQPTSTCMTLVEESQWVSNCWDSPSGPAPEICKTSKICSTRVSRCALSIFLIAF